MFIIYELCANNSRLWKTAVNKNSVPAFLKLKVYLGG